MSKEVEIKLDTRTVGDQRIITMRALHNHEEIHSESSAAPQTNSRAFVKLVTSVGSLGYTFNASNLNTVREELELDEDFEHSSSSLSLQHGSPKTFARDRIRNFLPVAL